MFSVGHVEVIRAIATFKFDAPVVVEAIADSGEACPACVEVKASAQVFDLGQADLAYPVCDIVAAEREIIVADPVGAGLEAYVPALLVRVGVRRGDE